MVLSARVLLRRLLVAVRRRSTAVEDRPGRKRRDGDDLRLPHFFISVGIANDIWLKECGSKNEKNDDGNECSMSK